MKKCISFWIISNKNKLLLLLPACHRLIWQFLAYNQAIELFQYCSLHQNQIAFVHYQAFELEANSKIKKIAKNETKNESIFTNKIQKIKIKHTWFAVVSLTNDRTSVIASNKTCCLKSNRRLLNVFGAATT